MQKLFKRSLAMVLSIMMVVTMFSGMTFASADTVEPFTEWTEGNGHLFHIGKASAVEGEANWNDYRYLAQEFVPERNIITGVQFGFILTGGSALAHVEIRKGDVNSEAIYTTEVPINSRGNLNAMYEFGFDEEVAVTPGEVYYLVFYFAQRDDGNVGIVVGSDLGASGADHPLYVWQMNQGGEVNYTSGNNNLVANFKIISTPGMNKLVRDNDAFMGGTFHIEGFGGLRADAEIKTEGQASMMGGWSGKDITANNQTKAHACFSISNGGISFAKAKYFVFDLYLDGVDINNHDGVRFGDQTGWSSIFAENNSAEFKQYMNETTREGWNTIVVPLPTTEQWATKNVQNIWIAGDCADSFILSKNDALMGFDNFRIMDEKGYTYWKNSQAITAVEDAIAALPAVDALTEDHVDAVNEAKAAFDALDANIQALVWNADVLAAAVEKIAVFGPIDINAGRIVWHDFVNNGENHALTNLSDAFWVTADQAPSGLKSIGGKLNASTNGANVFHMAPNAAVDASDAAYVAFDVYVGKAIPASALADAGVNIGDGNSWDNWGRVTDSFAPAIRENGGLNAGWNTFILPITSTWNENEHKAEVKNGRVYFVFNTTEYNGTKISVNDLVFYTEAGHNTAVERNKAKVATLAIWDIPAVNQLTLDDKAIVEAAAAAYDAVREECLVLVQGADTLAAAQAKIAELESGEPTPPAFVVVDGEKDEAYSDAKSMTVTTAYAGVGQAATDNTTQAIIKTYYNWDDEYNYVYMEISEPGCALTGENMDLLYYVNQPNVAGYFFQCAGGGYAQWTIEQGANSVTSSGSNLSPAEKAAYIDGETYQTRRYEIKFARDPESIGFFVSPAIYGSTSYVVSYHAFYNTNGHFVKYDDESTWAYTDVPSEDPEVPAAGSDIQVWNMDTATAPGTAGWSDSVSNKIFTEGTGSRGVNFAGGQNKDILIYGNNQSGSNDKTNPPVTDISGAIDADGKTVMTMDLYVTDASVFTTKRVVFGLICATPAALADATEKNAWMEINTAEGKNAKWTEDFDLGATGLQNGWNHLAITMDTDDGENKYAHGTNTRDDYWDATKFWKLRVLVNASATTNSDFYIDDVRFMTPVAYAATKESTLAVKDVIIAINELPSTATVDSAEVAAIKEAYAALSEDQQAKVTNYSVIENLEAAAEPLDLQLHAMDKIDMQIIAAGNQGTNGTQGTITKENYVEGTGAHYSSWADTKVNDVSKMYLSLTNLPSVDFSVADYLAFDIYLNDVTPKWVNGANDINLQLGSEANWPSSDLMTYGNAKFAEYVNDLKLGEWNHVVIPLDTNAKNVKNLKMYWENAVTITGENPYVLFDDFRLLNEAAMAIDADRTAAKAVIAQIATLDASDDDAIAAAVAAYEGLSEAQQAYVTNYDVVAEIQEIKAAAKEVVDAIDGLASSVFVFNDCDNRHINGTEMIANPNSGSVNMDVVDGVATFWYKNDNSKVDFPMTVRNSEGVVVSNYDYLKFDIYLSEGMELVLPAEGDWGGSINFANGYGGIDGNKVTSVDADYLYDLVSGQWNTVTIPTSAIQTDAVIKQIVIRAYNIFSGGTADYVLLDNVRFEAANEITYADKEAIDAVKAQFDALSDEAQALVANVDGLNEYVAYIAAQEEAAAAVVNAIADLPAVEELAITDQAALNAAEAAYAALEADTAAALVSAEDAEKLAALRVKMEEIIAGSDLGVLCQPVADAIDALPAADAIRTSDEAAITSAKQLYDSLGAEAQEYMAENYAAQVEKLNAVVAELANQKQCEADAQAIIEAIAALPTTVKVADEEAVNAAKAAYDNASEDVQFYVTNKAVLDAAIAALAADKVDKAAADALTERIAFLLEIDEVLEEDVEWIQGMYADYTALNDNAKAYIPEESVQALKDAYTASRMFGPIDVQYRAFNKFGADTAKDGNAGQAASKFGKDTVQPMEGTSSLGMSWNAATQGEFHVFIYHYNQGEAPGGKQWETAVFEGEGGWEVPCPDSKSGTLNMVLDLYVSDPSVILNASGDCGFGYDVKKPNEWGNGGSVNKAKLMAAFADANNGEGLKAGWNQVIIPISFNANYKGQVLTFYDLRFYFLGCNIPAGFTIKFDDMRFMNQEAIDTILPGRTAAKNVTKAIYALAEDYTYEDGSAIVNAYAALNDEGKALVVGYDAFVTAFAEKFAGNIAADKAAAKAVVDQITALNSVETMFNDCDTMNHESGLELFANLNSGADDKSLAEGQGIDGGNAAKFTKKASGTSEFNEVFRVAEPFSMVGAETFEFDIYISDGMSIAKVDWSPLNFQSELSNSPDTGKVGSFDLKNVMGEWQVGQWNHVVVPLTADVLPTAMREDIEQIVIRLYNTLSGDAGEYIMIDNLKTTGAKTIGLEDKEAVEAAEDAYAKLTDAQKGYVDNYADLVAAREVLDAAIKAEQDAADKAAADAVIATIDALNAEITLADKEAVQGARAAYDDLTAAQKDLVTNLDKLVAAEEAIAALEQAEADKAAAAAVDTLIEAFPETVTPADAEQVNAAKAAYDDLTDAQKALVKAENVTALEAALVAIVPPAYTLGDIDGDNKIGAADALEALKHVVGKVTLTETQLLAGDVNKDNKVDAADALEILKKVVGKPTCF